MPNCLIIAGMHRSGTSALTGALQRLGVEVGSNVLEAPDGNVPGYYEHPAVLELHERLLAAYGSAWDDVAPRSWPAGADSRAVSDFQDSLADLLEREFAHRPLWAVKDPRLCRLLPLWLPVLARLDITPHVVIAHRAASEVAASLARRNEFSSRKSTLLWIDHVLSIERASRALPRAFVAFSGLLAEPVAALERIGRQLDLEWPHAPASRRSTLATFLDPGLRHNQSRPVALAEPLATLVSGLETALLEAEKDPAATGAFDDLERARGTASGSIDPVVVEHLHQFSRRETTASLWSLKEALEKELQRVSERLGAGLSRLEAATAEIRATQEDLAAGLDASSHLAETRSVEVDRSLVHLVERADALQTTAAHQEGQLADLRARMDRLQYELELENQLIATQEALDYLRSRVDYLRGRVDVITAITRERWTAKWARRLRFWKTRSQPPR